MHPAFHDREAGSAANRNRDYVGQTDRPYRGGRGDRPPRGIRRGREFRDNRDDRHSHGRPKLDLPILICLSINHI